MKYVGGKSRYGEEIANLVKETRRPIYEPFCGALWVTQHLGACFASDINEHLIELYEAVRAGWEPPNEVTREFYNECRLRAKDGDIDPTVTFVGFGCSWGAKWFGGFSEDACRNYDVESKMSLLRKVARCSDVTFKHLNYNNLDVQGATIYCDPPYAGTTDGYVSHPWDAHSFWVWAEKQVQKGNIVYVSEFKAPEQWRPIAEFEHFDSLSSRRALTDRLFKHVDQITYEDLLFGAW